MKYKLLAMDIDGTLIENGSPIDDAVYSFNRLIESGISIKLFSNMTCYSSEFLAEKLKKMGFMVDLEDVYTAVDAAKYHIFKNYSHSTGGLYLPESTWKLFNGFINCTKSPEFVLLGDLDEQYDYHLLIEIIKHLQNGAHFVVFHKNKYFVRNGKYYLDSGAFTNLIEDVTGHTAYVCGKPSNAMLDPILKDPVFKYALDEVLVVGDDIDTDIMMAHNCNVDSALIKTGKYSLEKVANCKLQPSKVFNNLKELTFELLR